MLWEAASTTAANSHETSVAPETQDRASTHHARRLAAMGDSTPGGNDLGRNLAGSQTQKVWFRLLRASGKINSSDRERLGENHLQI